MISPLGSPHAPRAVMAMEPAEEETSEDVEDERERISKIGARLCQCVPCAVPRHSAEFEYCSYNSIPHPRVGEARVECAAGKCFPKKWAKLPPRPCR